MLRCTGILLLLFGIGEPAWAQAGCIVLGRDSVDLIGTVVPRVYPGPPNYTTLAGGDQPDTVWVLKLSKRLCVRQNEGARAVTRLNEVQLHVRGDEANFLRAYRDREVVLSGPLRSAELPWHHLEVILWARRLIARAPSIS